MFKNTFFGLGLLLGAVFFTPLAQASSYTVWRGSHLSQEYKNWVIYGSSYSAHQVALNDLQRGRRIFNRYLVKSNNQGVL